MTAEKEISIWARALLLVGEKEASGAQGAAKNLAIILKKKKKGYLLPRIIKRAENLYAQKHGIKVFLAKEHPNDFIEKISGKLLSSLGKLPRNIEICVDKDLIGGFRVQSGNFLIKASIKDFLDELKNNINK